MAHAKSLSPVFPVRDQAQGGIFLPAGDDDFDSPVGRSIVDNDHLSPIGPDLQIGKDASEGFWKAKLLVICRDNDGKVQGRRIHLRWSRVNRAACGTPPSGGIISSEKGFVHEVSRACTGDDLEKYPSRAICGRLNGMAHVQRGELFRQVQCQIRISRQTRGRPPFWRNCTCLVKKKRKTYCVEVSVRIIS